MECRVKSMKDSIMSYWEDNQNGKRRKEINEGANNSLV